MGLSTPVVQSGLEHLFERSSGPCGRSFTTEGTGVSAEDPPCKRGGSIDRASAPVPSCELKKETPADTDAW